MKHILITGASSGIGQSIAQFLTTNGHKVVGTSRKAGNLQGTFPLITLDVTDPDSVKHGVEAALEILGSIDVLINNAGVGISGPIENTSMEEAKWQFETNYFGVVRMTNELLPYFKKRRQGMILNISSLGGIIGLPFQGHYSASKFALEGYLEALRIELLPFNIQVSNICPGDFKTPFTQNRRITQEVGEEYQMQFQHFLDLYEKDEKIGSEPTMIARLVERLLGRNNLKVRYITGKRSQTIGAPVKRMLGGNLFEKVMRKVWGIQ